MFLRSLTLLSILLFAADASIKAQGRPTQALQSAFAALAHRDWPALAAVVHPTALESLRKESLGLMILVAEDRRVGKQGGGYNPREVVIADHLARVGSEQVPQFPGQPTIGQLASLPVPEFFVRWCDAVYHADSAADPVRDVVGFQRHIFGEVTEGDSLAHVLYRRESRHVEMGELFVDLPGQVMIMPLKKVAGRWKLLLNDDIGWLVDLQLFPEPTFPAHELKWTTRVATALPPLPETPSAHAQPGPAETVRSAFSAFEHHNWETLAALVDSERLVSFQREQLAYLVAWINSQAARTQSAHDSIGWIMLSYADSLSAEALAQFGGLKVAAFPGTPTIADLAQLSPAKFFSRWCDAAYEARPEGGPAGAKTQMRRYTIGEVRETDRLAHVLYRSDQYTGVWPVDRMPLRRSASGWGLLLNDDIGWTLDFSWLLERP